MPFFPLFFFLGLSVLLLNPGWVIFIWLGDVLDGFIGPIISLPTTYALNLCSIPYPYAHPTGPPTHRTTDHLTHRDPASNGARL